MSTISDVAKLAGVSPMTVSRVINNSGYTSKEARARVEQAIAELSYVPNALARSLRFKRTRTLALILTDITNPFFTTVARGVEDVARSHGFSVIFCNTDESKSEEINALNTLLQRQVDGFLLVPARASSESIELLQARGVPVVVLDRRVPSRQVDTVRGDSEEGAYQLARHLLALGHMRIAMLSGPRSVSTAADRVAGYARAMTEAKLEIDPRLVVYGEYTQDSGANMTRQVLSLAPPPTALFATNNFIAFGAFRMLREAQLRVPDDLSVVTFDDLPRPWVIDPFLTVVSQPAYEIGRRAAELLLERLAGDGVAETREIVLPTELIVGGSSAPPKA
jgi:LacI family transcriptional regulator